MPEPETVALYARVSTADQDAQRQVDELREFVADHYPDADTREYMDIVSGGTRAGREEYDRLRADVAAGSVDRVVVDEISRLSRLGAAEVHEFMQHCLEHDTSVEDREIGLSIDVTDSAVDQAVSELIVGVLSSLAKIEHKQKLRRIQSGIDAAIAAGKWSGRPPRGFRVDDDGFLRVEPEEFLRTRAAVERVAAGEGVSKVADDTGLPASTLSRLTRERAELYLHGDADDDRVDAALDALGELPEPRAEPTGELTEDDVRQIVADVLSENPTK
jgi:DNA invertase Pin-like site-specific DNA recombinase